MHIELNTGPPKTEYRGKVSDITGQGDVTNDVSNVSWYEILRRVKTKKAQNTVVHTSA